MYKLIFSTVVTMLLMVSPGLPQGLGIGPQVVYQKARDADNGKLMFWGALRARLSAALGVEGSINYRQEDFGDGQLTVKSRPVLVTGLFYPFRLCMVPLVPDGITPLLIIRKS